MLNTNRTVDWLQVDTVDVIKQLIDTALQPVHLHKHKTRNLTQECRDKIEMWSGCR